MVKGFPVAKHDRAWRRLKVTASFIQNNMLMRLMLDESGAHQLFICFRASCPSQMWRYKYSIRLYRPLWANALIIQSSCK